MQGSNTEHPYKVAEDVAREERVYAFRLRDEPLSWVSSVGEAMETTSATPKRNKGRMISPYCASTTPWAMLRHNVVECGQL